MKTDQPKEIKSRPKAPPGGIVFCVLVKCSACCGRNVPDRLRHGVRQTCALNHSNAVLMGLFFDEYAGRNITFDPGGFEYKFQDPVPVKRCTVHRDTLDSTKTIFLPEARSLL